MSGVDQGFAQSRLVRISGEDASPAEPGTASEKTNFIVDFGYNLQQVKRVSILNVSFLNNAFNFIDEPKSLSNVNWTITIAGPGPVLYFETYTIDPGFYNIEQVITTLNTSAAEFKVAHPEAPTVTFVESETSGFVVAEFGVTTAGWVYDITDTKADGTASLIGPLHQLGFATGLAVFGAAQNLTATTLPSLQGLTEAYITSTALAPGNCFDEKGSITSIFVTVPITAPFGTLNVFECKQDVLCEVSYPLPRNIQKCDFSLRDRFGNLINLNGANLKLTLRVWYNSY